MSASRTILYLGTYEREYPRNRQLIRLLRRLSCGVVEIHEPFWERFRDKSRAPAGLSGKLLAGLWLVRAYLSLVVRSVVQVRRADAVVIGYIGQLDMLVLGPLFRLAGVPVIFNPLVTFTDTAVEDRGLVREHSIPGRLIWLIDYLALKLASAVIVDTPENAGYVSAQFRVAMEDIWVIDVGADESAFPRGAVYRQNPNPLHVLFYGKMIPLHGIETILSAIERLEAAERGRYCFEIIGEGQQAHLIDAFRCRCPDAPVVYRPWVAYSRLAQRIAAAEVVLGVFGTGDKAGRVVPNKVFQAMAVGAPIITRDSVAVRRVLTHEESALLVPAGDSGALAGAIRNAADDELRGRLGRNARAAFEQWGSDAALSARAGDLLDAIVPERQT